MVLHFQVFADVIVYWAGQRFWYSRLSSSWFRRILSELNREIGLSKLSGDVLLVDFGPIKRSRLHLDLISCSKPRWTIHTNWWKQLNERIFYLLCFQFKANII